MVRDYQEEQSPVPDRELQRKLCECEDGVQESPEKHTNHPMSHMLGWKKYTFEKKDESSEWELTQSNAEANEDDEYEDDAKPQNIVVFLIPEWVALEKLPETAFFTAGIMGAQTSSWFQEGAEKMIVADRLAYGAACDDWTDIDDCRIGKHQNHAALVFVGNFQSSVNHINPEGHDVWHMKELAGNVFRHMDSKYYTHVTVVICRDYDPEVLKELACSWNAKGSHVTYVMPQFNCAADTMLQSDEPHHLGTGDVKVVGSDTKIIAWIKEKDKRKAPVTWEDTVEDPRFMNALKERMRDSAFVCAFPAEEDEARLDELGPLDEVDEIQDGQEVQEHSGQQPRQEMTADELEEAYDLEKQMLEELPLPNMPKSEAERREQSLGKRE